MNNTERIQSSIAIIGMACRLPGAADYRRLWQNLIAGICSIRHYDRAELLASGVPDALVDRPDYVPAHGFLDGYDSFDAAFFGYLPREAEITDPQHRILLECAWEAMEDAGYAMPPRVAVGVFASVTINTYLANNVLPRPELLELLGEQQIMLGADKDYAALRIAHKLSLLGPAVVVQAACASSLVAVHVACRSLLTGECDMALAGGASVRAPQIAGYLYVPGGTNSEDGFCRAFDARATGSVAGSGAGVVLLKRLEDALSDRDHIHAVILGTAVNNDGGERASFIAPTVEGQVRAIHEASEFAGVEPDSVTMVEAHGTGTQVGDPIEWEALSRGYPRRDGSPVCILGSLKPNIGHLDAAAGIAGLIKATLALQNRCVPPSPFFERLNPAIEYEKSRFQIVTKPTTAIQGSLPLRAGVNAIGMGGVNAHVILEESPKFQKRPEQRAWQVLSLAAKTPRALQRMGEGFAEVFESASASPSLDAAALTLQRGRCMFDHRMAVVATPDEDVSLVLRGRLACSPRQVRQDGTRVAFLFPGQGTHAVGMGMSAARTVEVVRRRLEECCMTVREVCSIDIAKLLKSTDELVWREPCNAQLGIFTVSWAIASALIDAGIRPDVVAGHSLGEITAASIAGVLTLADAVALIAERGRAMEQAPPGRMLAVAACADTLRLERDDLWLAAVNGPMDCTVAGKETAIESFEIELRAQGIPTSRLAVNRAFHTPLMEHAAARVKALLGGKILTPARIPLISSVAEVTHPIVSPEYWSMQLLRPVRFDLVIERLSALSPACVIETGPRRILSDLFRGNTRTESATAVSALDLAGTPREPESFARALAVAWEVGSEVDWEKVGAPAKAGRIPLPTYPFERRRYWLQPPCKSATVPPHSLPSTTAAIPEAVSQTTDLEDNVSMAPAKHLAAKITILADRIVIVTGEGTLTEVETSEKPMSAAQQARPLTSPEPDTTPPAAPNEVTPPRYSDGVTVPDFSTQEIAREIMGLEVINRRDDLLALGANSLMLTRIVSTIRARTGVDLCIADVLRSPSIEQIDALIGEKKGGGSEKDVSAPIEKDSSESPVLSAADINRLLAEVEQFSADDVQLAVGEQTGATQSAIP
jgi:acyl transferase domain-containing protein